MAFNVGLYLVFAYTMLEAARRHGKGPGLFTTDAGEVAEAERSEAMVDGAEDDVTQAGEVLAVVAVVLDERPLQRVERAVEVPWLTALTWPGCPLPSKKEPPRR